MNARTVTCGFASIALALAWGGAPASADEAQDQAIARLTAAGGSIHVIAADTTEMEAAFHLSGTEIGDEGLADLPKIADLVWLNLRGTKVTDAGLAHVGACGKLTRLHLEKTAIGDAGLAHLANLASLEYLNLYGTQVTDAGLDHLKGLTNLRKLYLWQTQVTAEGAAKLKEALPECEIVLGGELNQPAEAAAEGEGAAEGDGTEGASQDGDAEKKDDGNE